MATSVSYSPTIASYCVRPTVCVLIDQPGHAVTVLLRRRPGRRTTARVVEEFTEDPMHPRCVEAALALCLHLAGRNTRGTRIPEFLSHLRVDPARGLPVPYTVDGGGSGAEPNDNERDAPEYRFTEPNDQLRRWSLMDHLCQVCGEPLDRQVAFIRIHRDDAAGPVMCSEGKRGAAPDAGEVELFLTEEYWPNDYGQPKRWYAVISP